MKSHNLRPNQRDRVIVRTVMAVRALQSGRPTLRELADAMGTSERTARRYVEGLEAAHLPIRRHGPHYRMAGSL